jgi:single-strand DNA-binding protein
MGNLTKNPSFTTTSAGTNIIRLRIAANQIYKGQVKETLFINVVGFGNLALTCNKYLQKGAKVLVEGRLREDKYINKEAVEVHEIQVIAHNVHFINLHNQANPQIETPIEFPVEPVIEGEENEI